MTFWYAGLDGSKPAFISNKMAEAQICEFCAIPVTITLGIGMI
jgi:hypothetical protein